MTRQAKNKEKTKNRQRTKPKTENTSFKSVVKRFVGHIAFWSKDEKQKVREKNGNTQNNSKSKKIKIVFFLGLLVLVFVGSSVGFAKCDSGFRKGQ